VRADDPNLKRLTPPKLTLLERTYLPQIVEGLAVTGRHIAGVAVRGRGQWGQFLGGKGSAITVEYPEEQHVPPPNYRGVHRLNKDENGRVKCVACMLCATACPAHCIDIVGATAPETWDDREKYPESFVIDELRCIYCGMCEEACPVDAIELTGLYDLTGLSREQMIFDKAKLLSVFDMTKDAEPMRTGNPPASLPVPTRPEAATVPGPEAEPAVAPAALAASSPQGPTP
jgi:NADH-quinone oxidoreductase subunit I